MAKDRAIGAALVVGAVLGVIIYGFLLYKVPLYTLEITAFIAVLAILAILGWIGYVMATTPPPMPLEPETPQSTDSSASGQQSTEAAKKP